MGKHNKDKRKEYLKKRKRKLKDKRTKMQYTKESDCTEEDQKKQEEAVETAEKSSSVCITKDYEDLKDFLVCCTQQGQNYRTYTQRRFKNYVLQVIYLPCKDVKRC
ncbi:hypothetical protein P5673_023191 [Acropora cervicornis]|uniref:Uncharacterized protein n=1 Tax=Acropora cervicornis TaxID=6130 RepID=A0AAD9UZ97_ACRCE|nr:hypothetical protein P5673_023191 [Acropora cervicornis]